MSSFRNFGISFIAALLILGGAAYWAMGIVATLFDEKRNKNDTEKDWLNVEEWEDPQLNVGMTPIKSGRSFNMVVIGIDEYTDETPSYGSGDQLTVPKRGAATAILFVRFDKESRSIIMSSIPESTLVTVDYVTMTLGQAYGYRGAEYVKEKVSALTGMTIDFSIVLSGKEFATYATTRPIDKTITVPFTVTTSEKDGLAAKTFEKGQKLKKAEDIYTLLHYNDYSLENVHLRYALIQDVFLQTFKNLAIPTTPEKYYDSFVSGLNTDMTKTDVILLIEVLRTLPLNIGSEENTTTVTVVDFYKNGYFEQDGTFTVDMTATRKAFESYKK